MPDESSEESSVSPETGHESREEERSRDESAHTETPPYNPPPQSQVPTPPPAVSSVPAPPPAESSKAESKSEQVPTESSEDKPSPILPEEPFSIGPSEISLKIGETFNLTPSESCMWSISSPQVATIQGERTVLARECGTCIITGTCSSTGEKASITITIVE